MLAILSYLSSSKLGYESVNYTHEYHTFKTYTILDHDLLFVNSSLDDAIYLSLQPHTITGDVYINVTWEDSTSTNYNASQGDLLRIICRNLVISYFNKGGLTLTVWQMPKDRCSDNSFFTSHQNEVNIKVNRELEQNSICWFINFKDIPQITMRKLQIPPNSSLQVYNSNNTVINSSKSPFIATEETVIALHPETGYHNFVIQAKSQIIYADWTDSTRKFAEFTQNGKISESIFDSSFMTSRRRISSLIWLVIAFIGFCIFGFTIIIFFIKPAYKLQRNIKLKDLIHDFKID